MTPEAILDRPAKVLEPADREQYFRDGYLDAPVLVGSPWIARPNEVTARYVEESGTSNPARTGVSISSRITAPSHRGSGG